MLEYPFKIYGSTVRFKANSWAQARLLRDAHVKHIRSMQRARRAALRHPMAAGYLDSTRRCQAVKTRYTETNLPIAGPSGQMKEAP